MIDKYRRLPLFMPLPAFFSLLGIVFCAWRASGVNNGVCISTGCVLFQDMTINGLPMWWIGLAVFVVFLICACSGRVQLAKFGTSVALFIDAILLSIMLFIAPCLSCLVIALLFACTYISFRVVANSNNIKAFKSVLLILWTILFIGNLGLILKGESSNWILYGDEKANINMYFAPSCKSCREGIMALAENSNVAYFPVADDENDIHLIALMAEAIKSGKNIKDALNDAFLDKKENYKIDYYSYATIKLYLHLLKNKAHVIISSDGILPYFEIKGLPKALLVKKTESMRELAPSNNINSNSDYSLPMELYIEGSCGGEDTPPCPENEN